MKNYRFLLIALALILLVLAYVWVRNSDETSPKERANAGLPQDVSKPPKLTRTSPPALSNAWAQYYFKMHQEDTQWDWKQPIEFYGKVVDQDGNPLEGVTVECGWTSLEPGKGHSERTLITDKEGKFVLRNARGKHLGVRVFKNGYRRSRTNNSSFEFANPTESHFHSPDPSNPVVFKMIKMGPLEPVYFHTREINVGLNQPMKFDLKTGYDEPHGQVIFTLRKNEGGESRLWSMEIEVPEGGITFAEGEYPYVAPESGYLESIQIDLQSPAPPFWDKFYGGGNFFVKTPIGYALLKIQMVPGGSYLRIVSFYNPSGSRNLEFDENRPKQLHK
jgi:hypothetical protein